MLRKCLLVSVALLCVVQVAQAQGLRERRMERRDIRRGDVYDPYLNNSYDPLLATTMTPGLQPGMSPTVQTTTNARISFYPAMSQALNDCCQIRVICPDPQCKIFIDGKATTSTGAQRVFDSPVLPAGVPCMYVVRCTWMQNGQEMVREQALSCSPNGVYIVDFTRASR